MKKKSTQWTMHNFDEFTETLIQNLLAEVIAEQLLHDYDYNFDSIRCYEHIKDLAYYLISQIESLCSANLVKTAQRESCLDYDATEVIERYRRLFSPLVVENSKDIN